MSVRPLTVLVLLSASVILFAAGAVAAAGVDRPGPRAEQRQAGRRDQRASQCAVRARRRRTGSPADPVALLAVAPHADQVGQPQQRPPLRQRKGSPTLITRRALSAT